MSSATKTSTSTSSSSSTYSTSFHKTFENVRNYDYAGQYKRVRDSFGSEIWSIGVVIFLLIIAIAIPIMKVDLFFRAWASLSQIATLRKLEIADVTKQQTLLRELHSNLRHIYFVAFVLFMALVISVCYSLFNMNQRYDFQAQWAKMTKPASRVVVEMEEENNEDEDREFSNYFSSHNNDAWGHVEFH